MQNFMDRSAREMIPTLIAQAERAGATWSIPMFRACEQGLVRLLMVGPGQGFPLSQLDRQKNPQPLIVVLGSDGLNATGPEGFPRAVRLMRWAGFIMLHGTGGEPEHYVLAVQGAVMHQRLLLVECRGDHLPAWVDLKQRVAPDTCSLILSTPPGAPPHMGEYRPAPAGTVMQ